MMGIWLFLVFSPHIFLFLFVRLADFRTSREDTFTIFLEGRVRLWVLRYSVLLNCLWPLKPSMLLCPWNFPGKTLEWVALSFSRGSFQPRDWTHISCIGRQIIYHSATWEAQKAIRHYLSKSSLLAFIVISLLFLVLFFLQGVEPKLFCMYNAFINPFLIIHIHGSLLIIAVLF